MDADTKGIFDACVAMVKNLNVSEWRGVPLKMIELGPNGLANNQVRAVRHHIAAKTDICVANLVEQVERTWDEFVEALNKKILVLAPWWL
ncbi:PREDICTED: proline--tRNA ligase, cytoplasmic-like [Nicotiana attenuata]|uniref:proline--tRNA ligase, cytoplasmic-like n=1 Tax=Nicotiana attenuata TaxID=49451 RepID=UPI00090482CD|nr:PREDICTED: proline--tRNA ligase, cytoplasmic-like [Nicotiana attenuata]